MKTYPEPGSRIELVNFLSAEAAQARVLGMRHSSEGAVLGVAVELVVPSETFWGLNFQLKKTSAELHKLEQALKSGGVDVRLLKEFRDAVDCIRMAAGAVHELQECHSQWGVNNPEALSKLRVERIRRATHLCLDLANDLAAGQFTSEPEVTAELRRAIELLRERLEPSLRNSASAQRVAATPAKR